MADIQSIIAAISLKDSDHGLVLQGLYDSVTALNKATGNTPTAPPAVGTLNVSAANGTYVIAVTPASQGGLQGTVYNEISYSTIQSFGQSVTTLPLSAATHFTIPNPGATLYFRLRCTFDQSSYSSYALGTSPVASNLQSSAASENNVVLNQSNYAYIDSIAGSTTAEVRIYGAAGPYNGWTGLKGETETARPSATIVNVPFGSTRLAAYNGSEYQLGTVLPQVFGDPLTLVGQVSVVGSGSPTLPTLTPILSAGHLIGATFTPGSGLTQPPTLTVADTGGGTGAAITAIVAGGAMTGYTLTAAGASYTGATTITASGGVFAGATGGGTASGGNGGRLTKI